MLAGECVDFEGGSNEQPWPFTHSPHSLVAAQNAGARLTLLIAIHLVVVTIDFARFARSDLSLDCS